MCAVEREGREKRANLLLIGTATYRRAGQSTANACEQTPSRQCFSHNRRLCPLHLSLQRRSFRQKKKKKKKNMYRSIDPKPCPLSCFLYPSFPFFFFRYIPFPASASRLAQPSLDRVPPGLHCPFWPAKCSREGPGHPATGPDNGDQILQVTVQAASSV